MWYLRKGRSANFYQIINTVHQTSPINLLQVLASISTTSESKCISPLFLLPPLPLPWAHLRCQHPRPTLGMPSFVCSGSLAVRHRTKANSVSMATMSTSAIHSPATPLIDPSASNTRSTTAAVSSRLAGCVMYNLNCSRTDRYHQCVFIATSLAIWTHMTFLSRLASLATRFTAATRFIATTSRASIFPWKCFDLIRT